MISVIFTTCLGKEITLVRNDGSNGFMFRTLMSIGLRGRPHRTRRGEISVLTSELPKLLSPCLHQVPTDLRNQETRIRNRHIDFLVNRQSAEILRFKSDMIEYIRTFLLKSDYVEVQTPMLEACAGGAIARPFQTASVEFTDHQMNLRIAPELWLKRMIIGGFDSVFEIGSCFRNEGQKPDTNAEIFIDILQASIIITIQSSQLAKFTEHMRTWKVLSA